MGPQVFSLSSYLRVEWEVVLGHVLAVLLYGMYSPPSVLKV